MSAPNEQASKTAKPVSTRALRGRFNLWICALVVCPVLASIAMTWVAWSAPTTTAGLVEDASTVLGVGLATIALTVVVATLVVKAARPLLSIRGAMAAIANGETSVEALRVDESAGPEAKAWNQHLREVEAARQTSRSAAVAQTLASSHPSTEALEQACSALWVGCVVIDSRRRIVFCNGAAARMLRTSMLETTGKKIEKILEDTSARSIVRQALDSTGKKRFSVQVMSQDDDSQTVLRFSATRAGSEPSAPVIILIEDLTQQHAADLARDQFVTNATHELRTPLTNIRLYVERAVEEGENITVRGECLNVINQESRRLERIVTDMLSVAEIEAGSLRIECGEVRLDALMKELKSDYEQLARSKDVNFTIDLPPKLPVLQADREKLSMAMHNLIGNALKYTPAGGAVTVALAENDGNLSFIVNDNGIGIRPEEQEHIFEKFYRVSDQRVARTTGSGLGLSLAREVVRLHGGDITVQSQPDRGSTFTMNIPHQAAA